MNIHIAFPVPLDAWDKFRSGVIRFAKTYRQFPPTIEHEVCAMCCHGGPNDELREIFREIPVRFVPYTENGTDSGSAQFLARSLPKEDFIVGLTSRCYFHRHGWLERLVEARREHGPGLYATSANRQGHPLHLCLRTYALDCGVFSAWPYTINRRPMCYFFESGEGHPENKNFTNWVEEQDLVTKLVLFTGAFDKPDWFNQPNCFRKGDQSNVLIWDWHTDMYRDASLLQKLRMKSWNWRSWPAKVAPILQPGT